MSASLRRGACPGLSAPMATGDGLLARLTPIGRITLDAFIGFCAAARRHGNGTIEVTARGSLQARGLTSASAPEFAAAVGALAIPASEGVPVTADPLGDAADTIVDSAALADRLRSAIAAAELPLGPKVSVVVDGGGRLHLDALPADVRLRAVATAEGPMLHVALGGAGSSATSLAVIPRADAVDVVIRLLAAIAARGPAARAADVLRHDGIGGFRSAIAKPLDTIPALTPRSAAEPIGVHPLRNGMVALGIAPAFGHAQADRLIELAQLARAHPVQSIRPAPGRALLLIGATADDARALAAAAAPLGFITHADDPRRRVIACPGKPACAAGLIAARALAADIAPRLSGDDAVIHISGCAKGCAHPAAAALTVVGTERGCGIVRDGSAQATPSHYVAPDALGAELTRLLEPANEPAQNEPANA